MMSPEAPSELMRYATMHQWLMKNGLSHFEIVRLIEKGVIQGRPIRPGGRAWYNATQIKRAVLNGWDEPNEETTTGLHNT